jgi:hypothetical protein
MRSRPPLLLVAFALLGVLSVGFVLQQPAGRAAPGGNPMNVTRITVDHVRVLSDKSFEKVNKALE